MQKTVKPSKKMPAFFLPALKMSNYSLITPRLCRSRYQFAQQMPSEAVKLSAVRHFAAVKRSRKAERSVFRTEIPRSPLNQWMCVFSKIEKQPSVQR